MLTGKNSCLISVEYPLIGLIAVVKVSQLQSQRHSLHKTPLTSDTSCKFGGPHNHLRFNNSLDRFTEPKESCYTHSYSLLQGKATNCNQLREEVSRPESKRVPNVEPPDVFSRWSQDTVTLLALMCDNTHRLLSTREAHLSFGVQSLEPPWSTAHIADFNPQSLWRLTKNS